MWVEIALGLCGCLAASSTENTAQTEVRMDSTKYQLILYKTAQSTWLIQQDSNPKNTTMKD